MIDGTQPITGSFFAAVGEDGFRAFSQDGRGWINRQLGKEGEVLSIACFGSGRCVAGGQFGGSNHFCATRDGSSWTPSEQDAKYSQYVRTIAFFNRQFLAFCGDNGGGGKPFILPSDDGVHWGPRRTISNEDQPRANSLLRRFAQGNGLLVGVGDYGRKSATRDGIEWKSAPSVKAADTLIDIAFGNGVFVGGGMHGLCMRSEDGLTWTDRTTGEEGEHINSMLFDGRRFVGVGQGATYFSPDGKEWERTPNLDAPTVASFGAGVYVGSLWQGKLMRSTDAVRWEQVATIPKHVLGLSFGTLAQPERGTPDR